MNSTALAWLTETNAPATMDELARRAGRDRSRVSRMVAELKRAGLVSTRREGRKLVVEPAGPGASLLAELGADFPHVAWGEVLTGPNLALVAFFGQRPEIVAHPVEDAPAPDPVTPLIAKTAPDAARWTGLSLPHVHRLLRDLLDRAILRRTHRGLYLSPAHLKLRDFAHLHLRQQTWQQIHVFDPAASILWQCGPVAMYATRETIPGAASAGTTLAGEYGVPLIAARRSYLESPWQSGPSDAILQTYLEAPSNHVVADLRNPNGLYACLLHARLRPANLLERARQYGIPMAGALIDAFVQDPAANQGPPFPDDKEFLDLADQYGVP